MTQPEPPSRYTGLLGWLDKYIIVDKLRVRREDFLPRMRWWEWAWYVLATVAMALAFTWADDRLYKWLEGVPVIRWLPQIVTWPLLGLAAFLLTWALLPARQARREAKQEAMLSAAIWTAVWVVQWIVG